MDHENVSSVPEGWKKELHDYFCLENKPPHQTFHTKGFFIQQTTYDYYKVNVVNKKNKEVIYQVIKQLNLDMFFYDSSGVFSVPLKIKPIFIEFEKRGLSLKYVPNLMYPFSIWYKNYSFDICINLFKDHGFIRALEMSQREEKNDLSGNGNVVGINRLKEYKTISAIAAFCERLEYIVHTRQEMLEMVSMIARKRGFETRIIWDRVEIGAVTIWSVCPIKNGADWSLLTKWREHNSLKTLANWFHYNPLERLPTNKEISEWLIPILKEIRFEGRMR